LRSLKGTRRVIGLLPAGFLKCSCQDISIAGKGAGIEGSRSGLWFEMFRAIRILRPKFTIIENVSAITFRGLDTVLSTLAEIGYNAEWQNIRASDMGAPHRRERIWIVAYPGYMFGGDEKQNAIRESKENRMQRHTIAGSSKTRDVAHPGLQRSEKYEKQAAGIEQRSQEMAYSHIQGLERRMQRRECTGEWSSWACCRTHENEWLSRSRIRRVSNGVYKRVDRLKCLGNSIIPQIAQLLFEQIKVYL